MTSYTPFLGHPRILVVPRWHPTNAAKRLAGGPSLSGAPISERVVGFAGGGILAAGLTFGTIALVKGEKKDAALSFGLGLAGAVAAGVALYLMRL